MKRTFRVIIFALFIVAAGGYYGYTEFYKQPASRHVHAGFLVFVDGKQVDFSNIRYMSLKPCEAHGGRKSRQEIAYDMAHLHDNIGFVAHSHHEGATWGNLFRNLKYEFDTSKQIEAYVNGEEVADIFAYPLNAYDSVVLLVGNSDKKLVSKAITKKQIVKVEETSMDCGADH